MINFFYLLAIDSGTPKLVNGSCKARSVLIKSQKCWSLMQLLAPKHEAGIAQD